FLDMKPEVTEHPLSRPFPIRNGAVTFETLSFAYPSKNGAAPAQVLKGIDLNVSGGMRVALVGHSGAGKTTLANMIPRFYSPTAGRVLIDGRDARHFTLKALREKVSLVAQDAFILSASIRHNLLYARPDATEAMLWDAIDMANLREMVEKLPHGLDTIIG